MKRGKWSGSNVPAKIMSGIREPPLAEERAQGQSCFDDSSAVQNAFTVRICNSGKICIKKANGGVAICG